MTTRNSWNSQDPVEVGKGGTGNSSLTAYEILAGGTTSTAAVQSISLGSSGEIMTSNGAGALPSFQAPATFKQVVTQVFTTPGAYTYTPTSGMKYCIVEIVGGGGGGGGTAAAGTGNATAAGSGAAGGYCRKTFSAATIGSSQSGSVGSAGTGASAGANPGNAGGATTFGSFMTANGGSAGGAGSISSTAVWSFGNVGGTATGGDVNVQGQGAGSSWGAGTIGIAVSSIGGNSYFGGAAPGSFGNGINAGGYGSGGSGAAYGQSGGPGNGGNGSAGIVVITEFL